ncbi:unnamed protein product [Blepharisma stoltei]|uniref:Ubiquitin carboxyl-terminal hydrolase n=1 Tax=Blepharisma stoltei TaxID=1481888 RepID=A0AAU9JTI8_9CILI|nr:unnamed protein product [Blepharisma stoltei]
MSEKRRKQWIPLESNPEVITKYINSLGFPTTLYSLTDVLSWEEWAIDMLPQPVLALFLLYPISDRSRTARQERVSLCEAENREISQNLYYMKQTVGNACGTIAAIHAIANSLNSELLSQRIILAEGSFLQRFLDRTWNLTPEERGRLLEEGEDLESDIESEHQRAAAEGQSRVPGHNERVDLHFIAIVPKDGYIYELDGRAGIPINHGRYSAPQKFAKEACLKVIKEGFMDVDPEELRFNILALASAENSF